MRDPNRIKITLEKIEEIWVKHPDLRLGQLLNWIYSTHPKKVDPFYIEDDILIDLIENLTRTK